MGDLAFELADRGFVVRCWYGETPIADAHVEITRVDKTVRVFDFPSYRIWNIAAHFGDIVDDLLEGAPASERSEATDGVAPAGSGSRESRTTAGAAGGHEGAPTGGESVGGDHTR